MASPAINTRPTDRCFATAELLEAILVCLLDQLHEISDREDPRSVRTHHNDRILRQLLRCNEVNQTWQVSIHHSGRLQRALFLSPDLLSNRTWRYESVSDSLPVSLRSYYRAPSTPSTKAPMLNPVIQTTFPSYHLRFWHLSYEASGNRYCAYLIITRRDLPDLVARSQGRRGRRISQMLLSQPPCTALEAMIWEERDETKDYIGRTRTLREPVVRCDEGLTIGFVHEKVHEMFVEHPDVAAIKLTTT